MIAENCCVRCEIEVTADDIIRINGKVNVPLRQRVRTNYDRYTREMK